MNGIPGYLKLGDSPLETGKLETMQQAMAYWGVDGAACTYRFCRHSWSPALLQGRCNRRDGMRWEEKRHE